MAKDIEEFSLKLNVWKKIQLTIPNEWTPAEVCNGIQIDEGKLIIFGGSDINVEDSYNCFKFDTENYKMEKVASLEKAHVFVNIPFLFGKCVFALGNEYYVK